MAANADIAVTNIFGSSLVQNQPGFPPLWTKVRGWMSTFATRGLPPT